MINIGQLGLGLEFVNLAFVGKVVETIVDHSEGEGYFAFRENLMGFELVIEFFSNILQIIFIEVFKDTESYLFICESVYFKSFGDRKSKYIRSGCYQYLVS